jgi:hypothetical protein
MEIKIHSQTEQNILFYLYNEVEADSRRLSRGDETIGIEKDDKFYEKAKSLAKEE